MSSAPPDFHRGSSPGHCWRTCVKFRTPGPLFCPPPNQIPDVVVINSDDNSNVVVIMWIVIKWFRKGWQKIPKSEIQAHRKPQQGPENHYRVALSQPHSVGAEIETPVSRGRKHGLSPHHPTRSLEEHRPPAENEFYAYLRSKGSHLEHPFQYF